MNPDSAPSEIEQLRANIEALRAEIGHLHARVESLERQRSPAPGSRPGFQDTLSKFSAFSTPGAKSDASAKPLPPPVIVNAAPPVPTRPIRTAPASEDAEMRIGATWFNRVGALILLLAVAFFVKYSFDQGWLGPLTRVLMGAGTGALLIAGGEYSLARKLRQFSVGLIGAGVAMLYVSAYASHALYNLIELNTAFTLYCCITALGTLLAIHGRMQAVAILTLIGAFLTPVVLSTGRNAQIELLTYLLIIDAGFLAVGALRRWDALRVLSWIGTLAMFLGWGMTFYEQGALDVTLFFILIFHLLYHGEALASARMNWGEQRVVLPALVHVNNTAFIASVWLLADSTHHRWMGLFLLLTGLAQWALAWMVRRPDQASRRTQTSLAIDGAFILALAVPVQFDNCSVAIAWGVQSVACLLAARRLPDAWLRVKGGAVLIAAAIHLISIDIDDRTLLIVLLSTPGDWWHVNYLVLCFIFVALCAFAGAACLNWRRQSDKPDDQLAAALACLGVGLLLGIAAHQYDRYVATFCWLAFFVIAAGLGRSLPMARTVAVGILFATASKFIVWDLIKTTQENWLNLQGVIVNRAVICGVAVAIATAFARRMIAAISSRGEFEVYAPLKSLATLLPVIVLLATGTFEIVRVFTTETIGLSAAKPRFAMHLWLSMFWGVTATASLAVGLAANLRELRYLSIALFAATVAKAMIVDLNYLRMIYRVISFAVLGVLLLLASLFYQKRWSRLHKARPGIESTDA